jgi:uncharacterized membrane protein SirB2
MGTMVLGAILQEVMGILIAAMYVVVSKFLPALRGRWILSGLAYVVIYFVMNCVVLETRPSSTALTRARISRRRMSVRRSRRESSTTSWVIFSMGVAMCSHEG